MIPFGVPVSGSAPASRCRRCRRVITDPVSLGFEIGPDCRDHLGIPRSKSRSRVRLRARCPCSAVPDEDLMDLLEEEINDKPGED